MYNSFHYDYCGRCRGNETLSDCDSTSGSDLDHSRDVGVQCRRPTLCTPLMVRRYVGHYTSNFVGNISS